MPADDHPFDALAKQFEMERISVSPVSEAVCKIASRLKLPSPFDRVLENIKEHAAADSLEKIALMLRTCMDQVRRLEAGSRKGVLNPVGSESDRAETAKDLLLDAARKAESTRAKDRAKRIGLILANAVADSDLLDADEAEEMMRVAVDLSDVDVKYLRELIRIEGHLLETRDHIPRYDGYMKWEQGSWGGTVNPEIDSVFSKLESYGLVARIAAPNNQNIMADSQNRYLLLKKGMRFALLACEEAGK